MILLLILVYWSLTASNMALQAPEPPPSGDTADLKLTLPYLKDTNQPTPDQASAIISQIQPDLFLGSAEGAQDLKLLQSLGVTHVLNITSDVPNYHQGNGIRYTRIVV
jgi:hypothetical protein